MQLEYLPGTVVTDTERECNLVDGDTEMENNLIVGDTILSNASNKLRNAKIYLG